MSVDVAEERETLDDFDRKILHILQYDFPLIPSPYSYIGSLLQSTEEVILKRVSWLYEQGYIRRLGVSIDSRRIGYVSTLVALKVAERFVPTVAEVINRFAGVTHNYLREGEYNMWFTAIAPDQKSLDQILHTVREIKGVDVLLSLPAKRVFKVNVKFPLITR